MFTAAITAAQCCRSDDPARQASFVKIDDQQGLVQAAIGAIALPGELDNVQALGPVRVSLGGALDRARVARSTASQWRR